ncbi:pyrolysin [Thermococcus sp.]
MRRFGALFILLMMALVPIAGASGATWNYQNFVKQSVAWYYLYLDKQKTFEELYNLSVQMNVSNETLSLALELYNNATAEYERAMTYGFPRDTRTLSWVVFSVHIRKAYLYVNRAVEVLEKALRELGVESA